MRSLAFDAHVQTLRRDDPVWKFVALTTCRPCFNCVVLTIVHFSASSSRVLLLVNETIFLFTSQRVVQPHTFQAINQERPFKLAMLVRNSHYTCLRHIGYISLSSVTSPTSTRICAKTWTREPQNGERVSFIDSSYTSHIQANCVCIPSLGKAG